MKKRRGKIDEFRRGEMRTYRFEKRSRRRGRRDEKIEGKIIRKGEE